jgi:DsbC/DsbD-like thiol-disulfide interchange protein
MRRLLLMVALFVSMKADAQDPVHFSYHVMKTGDKTFALHIKATMDEGWHIYAQVQPETAISVPTKISFAKNPLVAVQGKIKEVGAMETQKIVEAGIEQNMYEKTVDFVQTITLKANVKTAITGTITYQACTNEMCLPPKTIDISMALNQ